MNMKFIMLYIVVFGVLFLILIGYILTNHLLKYKFDMLRKIHTIDKREEFENVYNQAISKLNVDEIKKDGIKNILKRMFWPVVIIIMCISMVIEAFFLLVISVSIICLYGIIHLCNGTWRKITVKSSSSKYKIEVIESILSVINPKIKYYESDLSEQIYIQSGFKDLKNNIRKITDEIEYELDYDTKVELCDLHLKYFEYRRKGANVNNDIFEGIIVKITRKKQIENEILIERNRLFKSKNRIKNKNFEFEKVFDVYAKDTNTIDMYFSEDIKEQILELYKEYGIMFEISIKKNNIYIRFFNGAIFENIAFCNYFSKRKLYKEYIIFTNILMIINRLADIL